MTRRTQKHKKIAMVIRKLDISRLSIIPMFGELTGLIHSVAVLTTVAGTISTTVVAHQNLLVITYYTEYIER